MNSTLYSRLFTFNFSASRSRVIPPIIGDHIYSDVLRVLLALLLKFGCLRLQNLCEVAKMELLNSKELTRDLYENVITQNKDFNLKVTKQKPSKTN